ASIEGRPARSDDEKARRRAESQARLALMAKLSSEVKLRVAKGEVTLADALREADIEVPPELAGLIAGSGAPASPAPSTAETGTTPPQPGYGATAVPAERTGASAPGMAPVPAGDVEVSATGADPGSEHQPTELEAQKAEAVTEARDIIGGVPGGDPTPALPREPEDAAPPVVEGRPAAPPDDVRHAPETPSSASAPAPPPRPSTAPADPREAKRAEAQKKLALMSRLSSEVKLRVAKGEISLSDALREAGIDPAELG
ncbi:MAG: hypothetical protein M3295_06705, partial [Chloroflexota bacterium]|nr:hypothetical protein [Chloroflexota bacterium]